MDRQLAKQLLILVNQHNDLLQQYAKARIEKLHIEMENQALVGENLYRLQGRIAELRRLITLRDEILELAKGE